jgi:hypothetical protein
MPALVFRLRLCVCVLGLYAAVGCTDSSQSAALLTADSGYSPIPTSAAESHGDTPPKKINPETSWPRQSEVSEPWASWGITAGNGWYRHSSDQTVIILYGKTASPDVLPTLYKKTLKARGWTLVHQWTSEDRMAAEWTQDEDRICMLISPQFIDEAGSLSSKQMVLLELPGDGALLGECEKNSEIPLPTMESLRVRSASPTPDHP